MDRPKRVSQRDIFTKGVSNWNLGNISFDNARGGTLTLGGDNNVNGILSVLDASSQQKILMNKDGILISDGKLTIENEDGVTIIDNAGIVSTANFVNDQVINSTGYTTTNTTMTTVTGSTLDAFTLDRAARVLVYVEAQLRNDNFVVDASAANIAVNDSVEGDIITVDAGARWILTGINEDAFGFITSWDMSAYYEFIVVSAAFDFTAGTHTLKLTYEVDGTGTARIGTYILGYIILGA